MKVYKSRGVIAYFNHFNNDNKPHREDGPAIEYTYGDIQW